MFQWTNWWFCGANQWWKAADHQVQEQPFEQWLRQKIPVGWVILSNLYCGFWTLLIWSSQDGKICSAMGSMALQAPKFHWKIIIFDQRIQVCSSWFRIGQADAPKADADSQEAGNGTRSPQMIARRNCCCLICYFWIRLSTLEPLHIISEITLDLIHCAEGWISRWSKTSWLFRSCWDHGGATDRHPMKPVPGLANHQFQERLKKGGWSCSWF